MPAEVPDVGEEVHIALGRDAVRRAVTELTEAERSVIWLRYGLDGDEKPPTFKAIGQRLGINPDQLRQIEERG